MLFLERTGPVRVAANEAAFPLQMHTADVTVDTIIWFVLNDQGKIRSMRAIWAPGNQTHKQ